jgi:hypothetical protein
MIGALTMSRMVDDPALSDQILEAARKRIADAFDLPASKRHADSATRTLKPEKRRAKSKMQ